MTVARRRVKVSAIGSGRLWHKGGNISGFPAFIFRNILRVSLLALRNFDNILHKFVGSLPLPFANILRDGIGDGPTFCG